VRGVTGTASTQTNPMKLNTDHDIAIAKLNKALKDLYPLLTDVSPDLMDNFLSEGWVLVIRESDSGHGWGFVDTGVYPPKYPLMKVLT
jgi:hypothetical protein